MNEDDNKLKIKGLSPYSVIPESANIRPKTGIAYNLPEISVTPQNNPQIAPLTATDVKNKQTLISNINKAQNTAGQVGYNIIDTAMGFTNPLWGLASGAVHGGLALKDIKDNGLTWSNALNAGLGIGMLGMHLPKKLNFNSAKILSDADAVGNQTSINPLTSDQINKAFEQARSWHINRINNNNWQTRALKAGFNEVEIPQLRAQLLSQIKKLQLKSPHEVLGKDVKFKSDLSGKASAVYWKTGQNGLLKQGIEFKNPNMSYEDAVSTFIHEFGHGATFGLGVENTSALNKYFQQQFPLIHRAVKYNNSLFPKITESSIQKILPNVGKNAEYFAKPTEMQSRGYEFMRKITNAIPAYKKIYGNESQIQFDKLVPLMKQNFNSVLFNRLTGENGSRNFVNNALSTLPLITAGTTLVKQNKKEGKL